jgi:hypothetical protein
LLHAAEFLFGQHRFKLSVRKQMIEVLTLSRNFAILPDQEDADVIELREDGRRAVATVQSDLGTGLTVFRRDGVRYRTEIKAGGISQVAL